MMFYYVKYLYHHQYLDEALVSAVSLRRKKICSPRVTWPIEPIIQLQCTRCLRQLYQLIVIDNDKEDVSSTKF